MHPQIFELIQPLNLNKPIRNSPSVAKIQKQIAEDVIKIILQYFRMQVMKIRVQHATRGRTITIHHNPTS